MAGLDRRTEATLAEVYGPVEAKFTIIEVPEGGAPEDIKEQWLGVSLPVRAAHIADTALTRITDFDLLTQRTDTVDYPVVVTGIDAVHALTEAGKDTAAEFWCSMLLANLVFRGHEGILERLNSEYPLN